VGILITKLDVPVGEVDEVLPAFVVGVWESNVDEGAPFWAFRFFDKLHSRLVWQSVCLAGIAGNAGANDIFPSGLPAFVSWKDVIEIEVPPVENFSAILAGVFIPLEDVVAGKFDLFFRKPVEEHQYDHFRNADLHAGRMDHLGLRLIAGQVSPAFEVVRVEIAFGIAANDLCVPLEKEHQGAPDATSIYRLPEAVQHKHRTVQYGFHVLAEGRLPSKRGLVAFFEEHVKNVNKL